MDRRDREVGVRSPPGTTFVGDASDSPASTTRTARALRAFGVRALLVVLVTAVLGVLATEPGSWAVFSGTTTSPSNALSTGTFDCPSRTGFPAASLYYSYMPATGSTEPDLSGTSPATPGTLAAGATRVLGNCSGNASPYITVGSTTGYVASTATAAPSTFSISLWFNATTRAGKLAGFGDRNTSAGSANYDRQIYFKSNGDLAFGMNLDGGNAIKICSIPGVTTGDWHLVVATFSASNMRMYLDGSTTSCTGGSYSPITSNFTGYWRFGYDTLDPNTWQAASPAYFTGALDETAVYPTALTTAQVDAVFAAGH